MCVLKLADLGTVATETISIEAMVRGHHVYQDSWDSAIKPCTKDKRAWEPLGSLHCGSGGDRVLL